MPVFYLASLAAGLGPESRTGQKMAGVTAPPQTIMLANIFDAINMLHYNLAGGEGEPPESAAERYYISEERESKESEYETFATGEEFEARRNELLQKLMK